MRKTKKLKKENSKMSMKKITNCLDLRKTKMVIDFNDQESASIKSLAVQKK